MPPAIIMTSKYCVMYVLYSAAKCLGARRVCHQAYQWLSQHNIISCVVDDQQAASACLQFAGNYELYCDC